MDTVAIAIPVFNESDGIEETLEIIGEAARSSGVYAMLCLQDDRSTDDTLVRLATVRDRNLELLIESNPRNLGHGPSVVRAYHRAIKTGAASIIQLDGDGQFDENDVVRIITGLREGASFVVGARRCRTDPWYRRTVTWLLRHVLWLVTGVRLTDANSPIRGFAATSLRVALELLPDESVIPNIHLAVILSGTTERVQVFDVAHRPRRGRSVVGSTWRSSRLPGLISRRFLVLVATATRELLRMRHVIRDVLRR